MKEKIVVIKLGGSVATSKLARENLFKDVKYLYKTGYYPVIVHGGGSSISYWLKKTKMPVKFVDGLRYTDKFIMQVVEMVLSSLVNKELVSEFNNIKVPSVGISGRDSNLIVAKTIKKLGRAALPYKVNKEIVMLLLYKGFVPVISPVSNDLKGDAVNVNADDAAHAVASSLKAYRLIFMTDTFGVLKNVKKEESTIHNIKVKEINTLIKNNIIQGGMIPKIKSCSSAIKGGVKEVDIVNGKVLGILKKCMDRKDMLGTRIY